MNLRNIREMAKTLRIKKVNQFKKDTLIRAIQEAEGNSPCFRAIPECREDGCLWKGDCRQL
jgi:hypothetical protein